MARLRKRRLRRLSPPLPVPGPADFIEFALHDPDALDQEWNYTDRAESLNRAGHRLLLRGFFQDAARVFERATRYDRSHYGAHVGHTEALILLGHIGSAAEAAQDALERYGRNCEVGAARAHVFMHQGDLDTAIQYMDIAAEHAPDSAYVWLIAGELRLALGRGLEGSLDCFNKARRSMTPWPDVDVRIALAFMEWGEFDLAMHSLLGLTKEDPKLPLAWLLLGDLHRVLEEPGEARRCYRRVAKLVPNLESVKEALSLKARVSDGVRVLRRRLGRALRRE